MNISLGMGLLSYNFELGLGYIPNSVLLKTTKTVLYKFPTEFKVREKDL